MDKMGDWCKTHHQASGLTKKVLCSNISGRQVEEEVIKFVKKHVVASLIVCVSQKYMPNLAALLSHVLVDVNVYILNVFCGLSINKNRAPAMKKNHRAMDDIRESIKELKYYKETIFKANKARR
ncbi:unnamed protein product [Brassica oleracea var. botrytis]|uniref:Exonuclease domain-containing protein n=2 Tax=Brassica TaxID=3705 RepID=A0A3P6B3M1_BRAOL|nr:unnamed protein product [Brassica napus]CDY38536.1 BnaC03g26610D [Brassica napus]VDC90868.1 unnamed protein product [Brassica oleracea]